MTNIVPYSFDEIQETLRQESIDSGLVSDAEYEGSNIAQMIRVMSYAVQSCNINTTYGVNEMLLTQSTEYNNVLKLARQLGYIPKQQISYRYLINLRPYKEGVYNIPKYAEFRSGDYTYYYLGTEIDRYFQYYVICNFNTDVNLVTINPGDELILKNMHKGTITSVEQDPDSSSSPKRLIKLEFSGTILEEDNGSDFKICTPNSDLVIEGTLTSINDTRHEELEVKEGILYKHYDENTNIEGKKDLFNIVKEDVNGEPVNYIDYNYYNIEDDGIELWVTHFDDVGQLKIKEQWKKRDYFIVDKDIFEERNTFLPLVDIDLNTLRVYFTIADTGFTPKVYSKVYVNLLETHGKDGAAIQPFEFVTLDDDYWVIEDPDNLIIHTRGESVESIEEVRVNAPTFHNTGNRAVTRLDYISICNRETSIDKSQVWGGETDIPNQHLGHIFFSFLPSYRPQDFLVDNTNSYYQLNKIQHTDKEFNLKSDEIRAVEVGYNSNIDTSTLGIFDTLESYKIITMALHHRWNYFVDIDLEVDIRKYYISQSVAAVNNNIKNKIVEYFNNSVESYDYDFFRSNIVRIIDTELGVTTGLELNMKTTIPLYTEHLERVFEGSNIYKNDIWFGYPYDGVLDKYQYFDNDIIPKIETENFLRDNLSNELYVRHIYDASNNLGTSTGVSGIRLEDDTILEIDICYGLNKLIPKDISGTDPDLNNDPIIGKVYINNKDKTLLYRLFVRDSDASLSVTPTECYEYSDIQQYDQFILTTDDYKLIDPVTFIERNELRINISYPFNDINFHKNTVPRLNSIKFF